MCYNTEPMIRASVQRFNETFGIQRNRFTHIFLDQHYPRYKEENRAMLREFLEWGNVIVMDPGKNLGLSAGFNKCLSSFDLKKNDLVFAYDPDTFPTHNGWGHAMEKVMEDKRYWWTTCWTPHTERETTERGYEDVVINGVNVRRTKAACLNSVSCLKGEFLIASGGAKEPNPFYGGFEVSMYQTLKKHDKFWGFLKDYKEEFAPEGLIDKDYREWKWVTTHGSEKGKQKDFELWLKERNKI